VFDSLLDVVSSSPWTYAVVFLLAFLDVLFPLVPSESAVITASVLAESGELSLPLIILVAGCGAILGDNVAYWVGRLLQGFVSTRLFGGKRRHHLERAERALQERGGYFIIIGRFIPGGRTAVAVGSGVLHYPWPRFLAFDIVAGILWATYGGLIGYFGGKAFEDSPLKGILLALGIAFAVAASVEAYRWWRRRSERPPGSPRGEVAGNGADRG
jgi:membrane protein DedA with SNARE-associated domain